MSHDPYEEPECPGALGLPCECRGCLTWELGILEAADNITRETLGFAIDARPPGGNRDDINVFLATLRQNAQAKQGLQDKLDFL